MDDNTPLQLEVDSFFKYAEIKPGFSRSTLYNDQYDSGDTCFRVGDGDEDSYAYIQWDAAKNYIVAMKGYTKSEFRDKVIQSRKLSKEHKDKLLKLADCIQNNANFKLYIHHDIF